MNNYEQLRRPIGKNYSIDIEGNIYSEPRLRTKGGIVKHKLNPYGYATVALNLDGKKRTYQIHRLLAQAFIPNPHKKPQINHKDGNKLNNTLSNLEWVTDSENLLHAWQNNLRKSNPVSGERYLYAAKGGFFVRIKRNKKTYYSGFHKDKNKALEARETLLELLK